MTSRVGEIRPSQLMFTYGVGSLVDLPKISVIVTGLEDWPTNPEYSHPVIESRLLQAVQFHLPRVEKLLAPPVVPETGLAPDPLDPVSKIGVPVATFPRWMVCPQCHLLAPLNSGLFQLDENPFRPDETCYRHSSCSGPIRNPEVLPARFLVACENGHLDDFPWVEFVHRGETCASPLLILKEHGPSGEARDLEVCCVNQGCSAKRRLSEAFGTENRDKMPACRGRRPHLRDFDPEPCDLKMRTIILGASNTWFPISLSAIAIPVFADVIMQLIDEKWAMMSAVSGLEIVKFMRATGQLGRLSEYSDERILEAIEQRRHNLATGSAKKEKPDLKNPEWSIFIRHNPELNNDEFRLRPVEVPQRYKGFIKQVVLVERMREVTALLGFTRIDSGDEMADEIDIPTKHAPLSQHSPAWVPANDVRGEGIFIQFDEARISEWCNRPSVVAASEEFLEAHIRWRKARGIEPFDAGFPGMRYVLLHSFSHALMRQLSLECGYAAASIRERIYSQAAKGDLEAMAGILIYTSAPDSEGTLGGLVSLGETDTLDLHISQALESMHLCASDPLCAEHNPGPQGHTIHAAACHACLFSPETSCEHGNRYLDRSTIAPTVEDVTRNFFETK